MRSSINIVSKEKIAGIGELTPHLEYFKDVEKLSMDVANYRDGEGDSLHVFLLDKDVLELEA